MTKPRPNGTPRPPDAPLETAFFDTAPDADAHAVEKAWQTVLRALRRVWRLVAYALLAALVALWVVAGPRPATHADTPELVAAARAQGRLLAQELATPAPGPLRGAVGTFSITPVPPNHVRLAGYPQSIRKSVGIDGDLMGFAWVVRAGNGPACAVMGADLLMVTPALADTVATEVLALADIPRERVVFTASHTHSAVGSYGQTLAESLILGASETGLNTLAWKWAPTAWGVARDTRSAALHVSQQHQPLLITNRLVPNGPVDDTVDVIQLDVQAEEPAVMVFFGAHPTSEARRDWMSADYPGPMRDEVRSHVGAFVSFAAGATGSMGVRSPLGERTPLNVGRVLATTVMRGVEPRNRTQDVIQHEARVACGRAALPLPPLRVGTGGGWALTTLVSELILDSPGPFHISALLVGQWLLVSMPGELSGEVTPALRAAARARGYALTIASFSGEYAGYLLPAERFGLGVETVTQFAGIGAAAPAVAFVEGLLEALPQGPLPADVTLESAWPGRPAPRKP